MNDWIWIRVKRSTIAAARAALQILGIQLHNEAGIEPDKMRKEHLRGEADHYMRQQKELKDSEQRAIERIETRERDTSGDPKQ